MMTYVMKNPDKRMKVSEWMFAKMIGYCRDRGRVYTDDHQLGGSIWLTPGNTTMGTISMLMAGMWQMPFRLGLGGMSRFGRIDGIASKAHKKVVPGDHWYLLGLGVDPDSQNTGLGTEAIEIGASQAHEAGLPVFLETVTESNVEYYIKRGFEVAEESDVEEGLRVYSMINRPK
jgi:ribosomal protein S18 acetylase RimI-like enzyme